MNLFSSEAKTSLTRNSMNRSALRLGFLLNALAVAWLAPWQLANAQCPQTCDSSSENTAFGVNALPSDAGFNNTAIGFDALFSDTGGSDNTATGAQALEVNTGGQNTATGVLALNHNTPGFSNTATGAFALDDNTTGDFNTATGDEALGINTTGSQNTATGYQALFSNTTGIQNTANGVSALENNTTGFLNTAIGFSALLQNTIGGENTATGFQALSLNTTGTLNTANGVDALVNNTTGSSNIALGQSAGANLTTGSNNIDIGNAGTAGETKHIRIGTSGTQTKTFIAGISGATVPGGVGVIVGSNGQLGTVVSSERFKDSIQPMDKASEAILALKPVTFRYKPELDRERIPQFGLVAEDVEKVNPDLVARDEHGKPFTVRYEAVNAMLLNEFLKARRQIDAQQKQIEALTEGLQKVSAQLQLSKSAPQTALNDQ